MKKRCRLILVILFAAIISFTITPYSRADTFIIKKNGKIFTGKVIAVKNKAIVFRNSRGTMKINKKLIKNLVITKSYEQDVLIHKKLGSDADEEDIRRDYMAGLVEAGEEKGGENENDEAPAMDNYNYERQKKTVMFAGIGAGGYMAFGDLGRALDPGYNIKLLYQYINIFYKFLGAEFEGGYSYLSDKEYDGGFKFYYAIPSAVYNYSIRKYSIQLQGKAGAGITRVSSDLTVQGISYKTSSTDLTVSAGVSALKAFNKIYILGIDVKYYYIFETIDSGSLSMNMIFGIKF